MGFTLPSEITSGILLISLLLCFIVAAFLFMLLLSTKRKKFITVPLTQFLSLIVVFIGTIFTITSGSVIPLVVTLLLENVLLIPHYMGMKNHRLERDRRPKEEKVEIVEPVVVKEEVINEPLDEALYKGRQEVISKIYSENDPEKQAALARLNAEYGKKDTIESPVQTIKNKLG